MRILLFRRRHTMRTIPLLTPLFAVTFVVYYGLHGGHVMHLNALLPWKRAYGVTHVVYSVDETRLSGLAASMNSVMKTTKSKVVFHLIFCGDLTKESVMSYLSCFVFSSRNFVITVIKFDASIMDKSLMDYRKVKGHDHPGSCANYALLFMSKLLPSVNIAVYIDTDTVIRKDLVEVLVEADQIERFPLAVLPRKATFYHNKKTWDTKGPFIPDVFTKRYGRKFEMLTHTFNNDFFVANLKMLRLEEEKIHKEYLFWMNLNIQHQIWPPDTETLMNFVFYKNVQVLRKNEQYIDKLAETSQIDTEKMKNGVFC